MKKICLLLIGVMLCLVSCASSKSSVSNQAVLEQYQYATIANVMGYGGSAELLDMEVKLFNQLHETRLRMIGDKEIDNLSDSEKSVLLLIKFSVQTGGDWGGRNTVSINFVDFVTGRPISSVTGSAYDAWVARDRLEAAIDLAIKEAVKLFSK